MHIRSSVYHDANGGTRSGTPAKAPKTDWVLRSRAEPREMASEQAVGLSRAGDGRAWRSSGPDSRVDRAAPGPERTRRSARGPAKCRDPSLTRSNRRARDRSPRRLAGKGVRGRWAKPCDESSSCAPTALRICPGTPRTRPILHTYTPLQRLGVRRYNLPTCSSAMCAWWPSYERIQCAYLLRSYPSARSTPDSHAQSRRARPLLEYPVLRPPEAQCRLSAR